MKIPKDKMIIAAAAFAGYVIGSDSCGTGIVRRLTGGVARQASAAAASYADSSEGRRSRSRPKKTDSLADLLQQLADEEY